MVGAVLLKVLRGRVGHVGGRFVTFLNKADTKERVLRGLGGRAPGRGGFGKAFLSHCARSAGP